MRAIYKVIDGKKICTGCHENLLEEQYGFIKKKNGKHIQKSKCKECLKKNTVYWRNNHRVRYLESRKRYREENKERLKATHYRQDAKYRDLVVEITDDRFIELFRQPCHYCGVHEELNGVDRRDNQHGYIEGNVVSSCTQCNMGKKKMGETEFFEWVKRVARHQGFLNRSRT